MKWLLRLVGIVLGLLGVLWVLQGLGIVPIGFMAGHIQYALLGIAAFVVGLGLVLLTNRRERGVPPSR